MFAVCISCLVNFAKNQLCSECQWELDDAYENLELMTDYYEPLNERGKDEL